MSKTTIIPTNAISTIREVMPENTVYVGETYDFDARTTEPTVTVMGNFALGASLNVAVARYLGRRPAEMAHTTGYVKALTELAAGLPLTQDDWYSDHRFVGAAEITALAKVLSLGEIVAVVRSDGKTVEVVA